MTKDVLPSSLGLRNIALLDGVAPERLAALARECAWRNCEAGQRIISRDAGDRDMYMIASARERVADQHEPAQGGRAARKQHVWQEHRVGRCRSACWSRSCPSAAASCVRRANRLPAATLFSILQLPRRSSPRIREEGR